MSFVKKPIAAAIIVMLAVPTAAIAGATGGGTELPSDAAGKGTQSPQAGGAGNPKSGSMEKGGSMKKGDSMKKDGSMEKGGGKM